MNLFSLLAVDNGIEMRGDAFLPPQGSTFAQSTDWAFYVITWISVLFFCIVVGAMLLFMIKYRRRPDQQMKPAPTHHTLLEITWSVVPLVIVIILFFVGFVGFSDQFTPPSNATNVEVDAKKWAFTFTYSNGGVSGGELWVEVNKPVRLVMTSSDVLHGFYVPAMRAHRNIVPGRVTDLWFTPIELGTYNVFCTQYCGDGHSTMHADLHVVSHEELEAKLREFADVFHTKDPVTGAMKDVAYEDVGKKLYTTLGCNACHSVNPGERIRGPSWGNMYLYHQTLTSGHEVAPDVNGMPTAEQFKSWEAYLDESIMAPSKEIVANYENIMPSFDAQLGSTDPKSQAYQKRKALIAYIKSLSDRYNKDVKAADSFKHVVAETQPDTQPQNGK